MRKVNDICCKCGACINTCAVKAIKMEKDKLFEHAYIDEKHCVNCKQCYKVCPYNKKYLVNDPKIYVGRLKNDEDIKKSSSGGIFGQVARTMLKQQGIVYGAAYTNDFMVEHQRIDALANLDKVLTSKYILSKLGNIYQNVKKDLECQKKVLFSGTPCQIAGLKSYLNKEYENLYTIDLVCHGSASPLVWEKYKNELEKKYNSKIADVNFRYYDKNNPSLNFYVKFANGNIYRNALYDDPYGKAFLTNLIFDENCYNCRFCNFKNISDITLGDAHGYYNANYPAKNSLIKINTEKGKKLFDSIKDDILLFNDFNFEEMCKTNYPIMHPPQRHYNVGKVNINAKSIAKELQDKCSNKSFEKVENSVGILNFHYENFNYGANLVAYSLSKAVERLGYEPFIIDFDPFEDLNAIDRAKTWGLFNFRQKRLRLTPRYKTQEELKDLNKYFDRFIVGSDQVWRKACSGQNFYAYFLNFASDDKLKVSYAASFGKSVFEGDNQDIINCTKLLNRIDHISVRENDAVNICHDCFRAKSKVVLDPTLLLTANDYKQIIDETYDEKVDVAVYFVMDTDNTVLKDKNLNRLFANKKIVNIKGEYVDNILGNNFIYNSVEKWLDGISKCEYLVTDSYHGVIFGILFKKKIICIGKNSAALSRFSSLFENLGGALEKINYSSLDDVQDINFIPDYKEIEKNLKKLRENSNDFLKQSLKNSKNKRDEFSIAFEEMINNKDMQQENNKLNEMLNLKDNTINELNNIIDSKDAQMYELNKRLEDVVASYNEVIGSKSWRYTGIIRKILRKLRGNK